MAINGRQVVAVVPARGGSKGVIGKNMRRVNRYPLIWYTLQAALGSKYIDEVFISSDDEETLLFGKKTGVTTICRPKEFSTDRASAGIVVEHFLSTIPELLKSQDPYIVYLQPTSPLRTAIHIDDALSQMTEVGLERLLSVTAMCKTPFKAFVLDGQGLLQSLFDEKMTNERRQALPLTYLPNGAIYVFPSSDFVEKKAFPSNGSYPYIMTEKDSLDIDTEDDLISFAELLAAENNEA